MSRRLQSLGFTDGEEKVYTALLKLGTSTTGPIAKLAGVSRSKLYEILEKLAKKGVVSHYKKNNVLQFTAAHPDRIVDFLEKKELELKRQKEDFSQSLPFFENLLKNKDLQKEAQVFEGMQGIKNVREQALQSMKKGSFMLYFGNPASGHSNVLGYWDDWNRRRIRKGIATKIIYNPDAKDYAIRRKKQALTQVKLLPNYGRTPAWIEIYENTVALVLKEKTPMSIVINNALVAESFRTYFEILWSVSK